MTHLSYGNKLFYYDSNTQSHFFLEAKYKKRAELNMKRYGRAVLLNHAAEDIRDVCFH